MKKKPKTKGVRCDAFKKFLGPKLDDPIMKDIKKPKSPEQRARELFKIVYQRPFPPTLDKSFVEKGFVRLARYVLALEKKRKGRKG